MSNINDKIRKQYNNLTNRQKVVAKFILEDPKPIALHSAKEIGTLINTSETTVIRLCYALGYSGYSDLQKEIRENYLLQTNSRDSINKFKEMANELEYNNDIPSLVTNEEIEYINETNNKINMEVFHQIVDEIIQAKNIYIVGLRTSYSAAHWLSYTLNIIKGNTVLYRGSIDDTNYFTDMRDDSLVITLSFPRYAKETLSFVSAMKKRGARVIAITDDELSPIGQISDLLLKVMAPKPISIKGMPVIFSLLNSVVTAVMTKDSENIQKRISTYDETNELLKAFMDEQEKT